MRIIYTDEAVQQLQHIYEYIKQDNQGNAQSFIEKILRKISSINTFPYAHRKVPEYEDERLRELIIKPYRVIYLVKEDSINIVTILHGARILPNDLM